MQQFTRHEAALLDQVDAAPMLAQVQAWSAINTGTGNLSGLAEQAAELAEAFAALRAGAHGPGHELGQDDREQRKSREGAKSVREISFMIRTCVPGGKLTAEQLLSAIDMGDELGNGTIRLTTRQAIQHHGVVKGELKKKP